MFPLLKHLLFAMLFDEKRARRWLAMLFGYLAVLAVQVFGDGVEKAFAWTTHQWAVAIATAVVASIFAAVNPTGKVAAKPALVAVPESKP